MMELWIGGQCYSFKFGFGFMKEINKEIVIKNGDGVSVEAGLRYAVASLYDGDAEKLAHVLAVANKGQDPRLTPMALERYIEDECEDIEALFEETLHFLWKSNVCRKVVATLYKNLEKPFPWEETDAKAE